MFLLSTSVELKLADRRMIFIHGSYLDTLLNYDWNSGGLTFVFEPIERYDSSYGLHR
jgi:hypothetical protein